MERINSEDEEVFPTIVLKIWRQQAKDPGFRPPR